MQRCEHTGYATDIRPRLLEESQEHRHLKQQDSTHEKAYTKRVDQAFSHHRAQSLGKRCAFVLGQQAATGNLTHTGDYQAGTYETKMEQMQEKDLGCSSKGRNVSFHRKPLHTCAVTPNTREKSIHPQLISCDITSFTRPKWKSR